MGTTRGIIFNIQHFSIHDGPGIRTTVFLKGCPLRCPWCSNPESQRMNPEPMLDAVTKAPGTTGQEKTVDEIIDEVMKDIDFYEESGGGMTLSGGEIFAQFKHKKKVGVHNSLIIENIHYAFKEKKKIVLRIPVIPQFNDSLADAEEFSTLFNSLDIDQVQLLPFHQFGENKYKLLGRRYEMEGIKALHPGDLYDYQQVFLEHDIHCYF